MNRILRKKVIRDLKENFFRYFALFMLIVMGMYLVVSITASAETLIKGVEDAAIKNKVEDGQFILESPLKEEEISNIKSEDVVLEESFYLDYLLKDDSTIRIYKNRENINLLQLDSGKIASNTGEIVLEKRYCEEKGFKVGDNINISGEIFKIVGIGTVPDYDAMYKSMSDMSIESTLFGLGFVSEKQYERFKAEGKYFKGEEYIYSYILGKDLSQDKLKSYITSIENNSLITFLEQKDNRRIKASIEDVIINRNAGFIAGIIMAILLAYIISIFVIHEIEKEVVVIGALYALGLKKKDLILHYLTLPAFITAIGGFVGTIIGFSKYGVDIQLLNSYSYFSIPKVNVIYPLYLIVYGIFMPITISIVVNYFVVNKKLSKPALKMLRNEKNQKSIRNINLGNLGFIRRFQIRQFIKEFKINISIIFGMFVALLITILGLQCYTLSNTIKEQSEKDIKYEYMYTLKYPSNKVFNDGEAFYVENLKKDIYGNNLNVTLIGIKNNNPYFDFSVENEKNKVVISDAVATKYNVKIGENIVLSDDVNNINYAFIVQDIVPYTVGLNVFMNIDSMRNLFNKNSDYYNVIMSKKPLDIENEALYSKITKEDIVKSSEVFIKQMWPMITLFIVVSVIIFSTVMYLMTKVMIDRSSSNISLIKIFGFRKNEVKKLYLNGNFYVIALGGLLAIPLGKCVMDIIYPSLVSNVACGIYIDFSWKIYAVIYFGIIFSYLIISKILVKKLNNISLEKALKNKNI